MKGLSALGMNMTSSPITVIMMIQTDASELYHGLGLQAAEGCVKPAQIQLYRALRSLSAKPKWLSGRTQQFQVRLIPLKSILNKRSK